jgi:hypothetical protein
MLDLTDIDFFYFNIISLLFIIPTVLVLDMIFDIASSFLMNPKGRNK